MGADDQQGLLEDGTALARRRSASIFVVKCTVVASLGSLLLGYDIGVVSGILPYVTEQFELSDEEAEFFVGVMQLMALFGALFGGQISDRYGRRMPMIVAGVLFLTGAVCIGLAQSYFALMVGRFMHGFAIGLKLMISPVYISELAPPQSRGFLVSFSEICINIGILCAFAANAMLEFLDDEVGWRLLFMGSAPAAVLLLLCLLVMPESPRWLVANGRAEDAKSVLDKTFATDQQANEAMTEIKDTAAASTGPEQVLRVTGRAFLRLGREKIVRIGIAVALFQQLSGIEAFMFYIPTALTRVGFGSRAEAIRVTVAIGVVKLVCSVVGAWLTDILGRKPMSIWGAFGMAGSLIVLAIGLAGVTSDEGVLVDTHSGNALYRVLTLTGIMGYIIFFASTAGPLCWLLLGEMFPLRYRSAAMSLATAANRAAAFLISVSFLSYSNAVGLPATYGTFALLNIVAAVTFQLYLQETKGLSLEEIEESFTQLSLATPRNPDE